MKSKSTLKWLPVQLPKVRIILEDVVVEVVKQGGPIDTRTLLDYIKESMKKKSWLDNRELLQTATSVPKDSQSLNGEMQYNKLISLSSFHFNDILFHFSTTRQLGIWLK